MALLLAGCGFNTNAVPAEADGMMTLDASLIDDATLSSPGCATFSYLNLHVSACPTSPVDSIVISFPGTSIDTDTGISSPPGPPCAPLEPGSSSLCAIAASSITIARGATLSAHGKKPLVLVGHTIDVQGTIDVASHANLPDLPGAAADLLGCNSPTANMRAIGDGGGQGGTFHEAAGGQGGSGNNPVADRGGAPMSSTGITTLRGGCPGGPNSDETKQAGGHGGGAVWLAVDDQGTISIGNDATINASGAGGPGGALGGPRGGFGGGSGGMILFKARTLKLASLAKIFADGGGGGAGAANLQGGPGGDPTAPGIGGAAGVSAVAHGGPGFPAMTRAGEPATGGTNGGGGGGGGGGTIWMDVRAQEGTTTISPLPVRVP